MAPALDDARAEAIGRDPVAAEGVERFNASAESQKAQREAILLAKKFRAGDQWPQEVKDQRMGAAAIQGQAPQPLRPCLTIDRISQPVRQVSNGVRQSNFAIDCVPVGNGADKDTAKIFEGWMRRVQNEARADAPIEWAADSAAEGGIGWFRLTAYEIDDESFDQDLKIERVPNSLAVYPDPHAMKPTRSDMRYLLITEDLPRSEYIRIYGDDHLSSLDTFRAVGDTGGWVTDKTIRIAEYWRVEYDDIRLVELNTGQTLKGDAIPKELKKGDGPNEIKRERVVRTPKVKWSKINATKELQKTDWMGSRIPFVPILGEELNVDGKCVLRGVIEPAMDAQRMINYTFSAAIESAALAPKSPWVYAEGQIENYKAIWQTANTANHAGLPYTPVSLLGMPVPPPQRNSVEQPIQAMVELMIRSEDAVKSTTGIFDPSLGNTNPREKSGTAIKALQDQSAFGQSNYQDNVTRAMVYAGELMVELGPKLLDRPGRIIQILQLDDTPDAVMLGQPHMPAQGAQGPQPIADPANGRPVTDPAHPAAVQQMAAGLAKFYDLKNGKYGVAVTVGRDHVTKRQESNAALGELIPHLPPPMQAVLTPEYIETLDFQDSAKIADIARKALPPELQAQESGQPQVPPQLQAQMAHMSQALRQAKQIIDTDQVKADRDLKLQAQKLKGELDKVRLEGTRDFLLANVNNAAKILVARIGSKSEVPDPSAQAAEEAKATGIQMAHEHHMKMLDQAHELLMTNVEHQNALEQGAQAAALAPEPETVAVGA